MSSSFHTVLIYIVFTYIADIYVVVLQHICFNLLVQHSVVLVVGKEIWLNVQYLLIARLVSYRLCCFLLLIVDLFCLSHHHVPNTHHFVQCPRGVA